MRIYLSWMQDCGHGAAMECHAVVEAASQAVAKRDWQNLIADRGQACSDAFGTGPSACFVLPASLADAPETEILRHYYETGFEGQWIAPEDETPDQRRRRATRQHRARFRISQKREPDGRVYISWLYPDGNSRGCVVSRGTAWRWKWLHDHFHIYPRDYEKQRRGAAGREGCAPAGSPAHPKEEKESP
jgi:hypothetical protein